MNMNEKATTMKPRKEAYILSTTEMTEAQYAASERVHALVNAMAAEEWKPPQARSGLEAALPRLDDERTNRSILIDGDRGSGKTSLLVSLLDFWRRIRLGESLERFCGSDPSAPRGWTLPKAAVFPVGLVELQPLPMSTNLLLHVALSLRKLVEALSENEPTRYADAPPTASAWPFRAPTSPTSLFAWRDLVAATANTNGGLSARMSQLDAESYAIELEHAEKHRLDIGSVFRRFVDALVVDVTAWQRLPQATPPLFVLALDDADMNPGLARDLLDLVRTIHHPRLVFLFTGHTPLFRLIIQSDFVGALANPLKGLPLPAPQQTAVVNHASALAWRTYEKVLPENHRCEIHSLNPEARYQRLQTSLSQIEVNTTEKRSPRGGKPSLDDYLATLPALWSSLPAVMRSVTSMGNFLDALLASRSEIDPLRRAAFVVKRLWEEATQDPGLDADTRSALARCVQVDDRGCLRVNGSVMEWDLVHSPTFTRHIDKRRSLMGFHLAPLGLDAIRSGEVRTPLSQEIVAAFVLANTIAIDGSDDLFVASPARSDRFDRAFVCGAYTSSARVLRFGWPVPEARLIFDLLKFSEAWGRLCESTEPLEENLDGLALAYLDLFIQVADGNTDPATSLDTRPSRYQRMAQGLLRLQMLQPDATTRAQMLARWAREGAALLAAPESALPAAGAGKLLRSIQRAAGSRWADLAVALRRARIERARRALLVADDSTSKSSPDDSVAVQILRHIDDENPHHPWQQLVGDGDEPRPRTRTKRAHHAA